MTITNFALRNVLALTALAALSGCIVSKQPDLALNPAPGTEFGVSSVRIEKDDGRSGHLQLRGTLGGSKVKFREKVLLDGRYNIAKRRSDPDSTVQYQPLLVQYPGWTKFQNAVASQTTLNLTKLNVTNPSLEQWRVDAMHRKAAEDAVREVIKDAPKGEYPPRRMLLFQASPTTRIGDISFYLVDTEAGVIQPITITPSGPHVPGRTEIGKTIMMNAAMPFFIPFIIFIVI